MKEIRLLMKNGSQITIQTGDEKIENIINALLKPTFSTWRCADGDGVAINSTEISHIYYNTSTGQDIL